MLGLGEPLHLKIERAGKTVELDATPQIVEQVDIFGDKHRIGQLGIQSTPSGGTIVRYDPATAVWMAVVETYQRSVGMLRAIGQIVEGIRPSNEVGGVLRIAKMSGDIASRSLIDVVDFAVLLSINLGLINLFPVPLVGWRAAALLRRGSLARTAARPPGGGMGFAPRARSGIEFDAVRHLERSRIAERHPVPQAHLRLGGGEGVGELRDRLKALLLAAGLALVFLAFLAPVTAALAQNMFGGDPIADIKIEGTQRIEADTVRSYMQLNPGDPFAPDRIDKALKNLFATGLFADVAFRREGNTLIVKVVENPIINTIAFEGNDYLEFKDLFAEIQEKPRTVLTQSRVQADVQRILNLYRRSGRFGATVDPKIIKLDQNRVNLVFEIKEGSRTDVRKISFVGNKSFSDSELRGVILTTETAWYRFLVTTDTYDPDRLQVDRDRLRDFYLMNGYIDFKVISAVAELSPEQDAFYITFSLDEGERYKVGKVDVKTSLKDLDPEVLRSLVQVKEGEWYDQRDVDKTTAALNDALGSLGYAFVDVQNRLDRDPKKKTVNITFSINEGPKVYVERIDIKGNARTLDSVIRREFRLVEGDAFNSSKLQRTKQRLTNLGFFANVDVKTLPGSTPDKTVIEVNVEEQSTGELSFGLGYSTTNGPLGLIKISERNLLGKGQSLSLATNLSFVTSNITLSFTEPYFLGRPISAGVDIFDTVTQNTNSTFGNSNIPYDESDLGFGLRAGYDISEYPAPQYPLQPYPADPVECIAIRLAGDPAAGRHQSELAHQQRVHL